MPETKVGLIVEAKDRASSILRGIGSAGKSGLSLVHEGAQKAQSALKAFGAATVVMNQGLGLARKAMMLFRSTIGEAIESALKFRSANDPVVKQFEAFSREANVLKARLGDILLPVVRGLMDAFGGLAKDMTNWINLNRQAMATGFVEWLASAGDTLINGVGKGVLYVARAWQGWLGLVNVVKMAVNSFFSMALSASSKLTGAIGSIASAFGLDLGDSISGVAQAQALLAEEFDKSSDAAYMAADAHMKSLDEIEAKLARGTTAISKFWKHAMEAAQKYVETSSAGMTRTKEEMEKYYARLTARANAAYALQSTIENGINDTVMSNLARRAEIEDKAMEAQEKRAQTVANIITGLGDAWAEVGIAALESSRAAGKAASIAAIQSAQIIITALAAEAAAKAFTAHQFVPFIGIAIGTTVAGIAFSVVKAYLGKLPKAESGGRVPSSIGSHGMPAILHRDEGVFTRRQMTFFDRLAMALERMDVGGNRPAFAVAGGGTTKVIQNFSMIGAPTSAETSRAARELTKHLARARRRGF